MSKPIDEFIETAELGHYWLAAKIDPSIVFSPRELLVERNRGRFLWGPDSWELISVDVYIHDLQEQVIMAERRLKAAADEERRMEEFSKQRRS